MSEAQRHEAFYEGAVVIGADLIAFGAATALCVEEVWRYRAITERAAFLGGAAVGCLACLMLDLKEAQRVVVENCLTPRLHALAYKGAAVAVPAVVAASRLNDKGVAGGMVWGMAVSTASGEMARRVFRALRPKRR